MIPFVDRWHVYLGVSGLAIGVLAVVVVSAVPLRRADPTSLVVLVAVLAVWVRGDLVHGAWWAFGGALALASTRRSAGDGGPIDRWAIGTVLLAAVGLWATVSDTEIPLLVGTILGPVLVQSLVIGRPFGRWQLWVCLVVLLLSAIEGAAGTAAGLLGAICCVTWVLVAATVAPSVRDRAVSPRSAVAGVIAPVVVGVVASRVVGRAAPSTGLIVTIVVVATSVLLGAVLSAGSLDGRRPRPSARASGRSDDE